VNRLEPGGGGRAVGGRAAWQAGGQRRARRSAPRAGAHPGDEERAPLQVGMALEEGLHGDVQLRRELHLVGRDVRLACVVRARCLLSLLR